MKTLGYGEERLQEKTDANTDLDIDLVPMTPWSRVRPAHVVAASAVLALATTVVLWHSRTAHEPLPAAPAVASPPPPPTAPAISPPPTPAGPAPAVLEAETPNHPGRAEASSPPQKTRSSDNDPFENPGLLKKLKKTRPTDDDPFETSLSNRSSLPTRRHP